MQWNRSDTMQRKRFFFIPILFIIGLLFSFGTPNFPGAPTNDFIVVLDAGHGGHDPGNLGNGYLEKNIALNIVLRAGELLEKQPGVKVIYTRKDDTFVDLYVRGEIANKANADLFVSVHCDSHTSDAHGAGTFVLGLHANKQNFEIAKKENSVIYLEDNYESRYAKYDINSPESIIGLTIMQEEFLDQSIQLATIMQGEFSKSLKRNDRKVKQAGFIVLHQTFMPSILVETGFLTNKSEGTYLNSRKGQLEMGQAIADAIMVYKNGTPADTSFEATPTPEVVTNTPDETVVEKEAVENVKTEQISTTEPKKVIEEKTSPVQEKKETEDTPEKMVEASHDNSEKQVAAIEKEMNKPQEVVQEKTTPEIKAPPLEEKVDEVAESKREAEVTKKTTPPVTTPTKSPVDELKKPEKKEVKPTANLSFKVQLLASSKNLALRPEGFKGLSELSKEPYKNLYRYFYGNTKSYLKAKLLKSNAEAKGYTTAFIVAYKDGSRIPIEEALKYVSE